MNDDKISELKEYEVLLTQPTQPKIKGLTKKEYNKILK